MPNNSSIIQMNVNNKAVLPSFVPHINAWRNLMIRTAMVDRNFSQATHVTQVNISMRKPGVPHQFIINSKNSHAKPLLNQEDYVLVEHVEKNATQLIASGLFEPHDHALLHSWLYQLDDQIHSVIQLHNADILTQRTDLDIDQTKQTIQSPKALHQEIVELFQQTSVRHKRLFVLNDTQPSVVAFGRNPFEASMVLTDYTIKALEKMQ